jgi:hypothetical protein
MDIKENAHKLFEIFDKQDVEGFSDLLTDNSTFRFGNMDSAIGKAAISEAQKGFFSSIAGMEHELIRTWTKNDSLVVEGVVTYTRKDNSTVALPFVDIFNLEGEKICDTLIYMAINPLFNP